MHTSIMIACLAGADALLATGAREGAAGPGRCVFCILFALIAAAALLAVNGCCKLVFWSTS